MLTGEVATRASRPHSFMNWVARGLLKSISTYLINSTDEAWFSGQWDTVPRANWSVPLQRRLRDFHAK